MSRVRILSVISVLVVSMFAISGLAHAQQSQTGNQALGGLIDVVVNNTSVLNQADILNNALNQNDVRILNLNDVLNGNQTNVLSDILNNSQVLSNNTVIVQNVLNNNEVAKNFLNQNNIPISRVVAIDVLSGAPTIYVFDAR